MFSAKTKTLFFDSTITEGLLEGYVRLSVVKDDETGKVKDYVVMDLNGPAARVSGLNKEDIIGKSICVVMAIDRDCGEKLRDRLAETKGSKVFEYQFRQTDRRFLINHVPVSDDEILLFFAEITFRRKAEQVMQVHEILFEQAQDIILYVAMDGRIINANQKACDQYGYIKEELLSLTIQEIRHPSEAIHYEEQMALAAVDGIIFESLHTRSDGSVFPVEVSARTTETESGKLRIHIIRDITERKEQDAKIRWMACYDGLTKVLNRGGFLETLDLELQRAKEENTKIALLMFDIDKFKRYNDNFGHHVGDFVLMDVAERVQGVLRESDYLGRFGGDEFVILVTDVQDSDYVTSLMARIHGIFKEPIIHEGHSLQVSISLGGALYSEHSEHAKGLLYHADQAMYDVKNKGGNGLQLSR